MSNKETDAATFNKIVALNSDIKRYLNLAPRLKPISSGQTDANGNGKNRLPLDSQTKPNF